MHSVIGRGLWSRSLCAARRRPEGAAARRSGQHGRRPPAPFDRSAPPVSDVWLNIVMVVVFVLIGGAFSGAEIALVSLRESQVRALADSGGRRGQAVQRLLSDPNRFLAAVQVGVTLAGFFSAAFGASTLSQPLAEWFMTLGMGAGLADPLAFVLEIGRASCRERV